MKRFALLLLICGVASAQTFISPSGAARRFVRVNGVPVSCAAGDVMVDISVSPAVYYNCPVATPVAFGTGNVSSTRAISTTPPLGGGGDLSADRTLTCATCATSSNNLSFFLATSSAQLLALLNDETGSGLAVFGTSPTIVTPTIASFAFAQHNHQNAAGGGTLDVAAIGSGTLSTARGGTGNTTGTAAVNANLTGPITSSGNTTSIASQTGTGTKFVVDTNPALVGPTSDTYQTSGNAGIGIAPSGVSGLLLLAEKDGNQSTRIQAKNTDAASAGALVSISATADNSAAQLSAFGSGFPGTIFGLSLAGASSVNNGGLGTVGFTIGTTSAAPVAIGTNSTAAIGISTAQIVTLPTLAMTAGTMTATNAAVTSATVHRYDWTNAMVVALGASTTGDITVCTLPAKVVVRNVYVVIDTADSSANALTIAVGRTSAAFIDYIVASDAKGAANTIYGDASAERGTNLTGYDLPSITGTTAVKAHFIKTTTNLSTVTASTGHIYIETTTLP